MGFNFAHSRVYSYAMKKFFRKAHDSIASFLEFEAAGGICLVAAALFAIIMANSPLYPFYDEFLHVKVMPHFSLLHFINDALMAIFFFLIGLEIKQEFVQGELSSRERALLPAIAALGGMIVPALIYVAVNYDTPENLSGWAIPSATDIAFSLGVLALLGSRIPLSLKILLTAVAVMDDLGAIAIIALFYSGDLDYTALGFAGLMLAALAILARMQVMRFSPYLLFGVLLWAAVLQSGVHATLAGVATAFFIPVRNPAQPDHSPSKNIEHALHPWVAFGILPLFAFANAGVPFTGMGFESLADPTALGILLGLFVGKQIGIFGSLWLAVKFKLCPKPAGLSWAQLYGMSILCGIGFTMSLFIGGLAFSDLAHQADIRLGVLTGSLLSALAGYALLRCAKADSQRPDV